MKKKDIIQVTVTGNGERTSYAMKKGMSLFTLFGEQKKAVFSHCGGKGICGKCRVRFLKGAPLPAAGDRKVFTPEELREGFRLACLTKPVNDCEIELHFPKEKKIVVVTEVSDFQEKQIGEIVAEETIIAIDLGTTTVAMELRGLETGQVYHSFCRINPQRQYGADVISRIQASNQGEKESLQKVIQVTLEQGMEELKEKAKKKELCQPQRAFLAGNTAMGQLLMGYSVEQLGRHPFLPVDISKQQITLGGMETVLMPGISAFVGGDIGAGLYYVKKMQKAFEGRRAVLFIDLGTNGEMAIGNDNGILVTATAAGPAFEGGSSETIMGADMVFCLDQLLKKQILDETGLLKEPYFSEGAKVNGITLRGKDIRALQMAKAAVFAGICILIKQFQIPMEEIDHVYLAGGFGYYLQVASAVNIGLIPLELKDKVTAVGNTSLGGAFVYGRDCIQREKAGCLQGADELEQIIGSCRNINLAEEDGFQELYIKAMRLKPLSYKEMTTENESDLFIS